MKNGAPSPFMSEPSVPSSLTDRSRFDLSSEVVAGRIEADLAEISREQLARIFSLAEELREEDGAYLSPKETGQRKGSLGGGFDLMPLVVAGEEWAHLEAGLIQRIRAWNYFLRDVYTGQEILKAGVVPYEIVYADPNFHRGCARLTAALPNYLQLTAFDLQRTSRGQWLVMQDHLSVAEGASYALRKRQIMRQIAPGFSRAWRSCRSRISRAGHGYSQGVAAQTGWPRARGAAGPGQQRRALSRPRQPGAANGRLHRAGHRPRGARREALSQDDRGDGPGGCRFTPARHVAAGSGDLRRQQSPWRAGSSLVRA